MNTFCDSLSETIVISVLYGSFFRNYISIVLYIIFYCLEQPITAPVHIGTWRPRNQNCCCYTLIYRVAKDR